LKNGFVGLKTGVTKSAGPCLSSIWNKDGIDITIIVLKCKNIDDRFSDSLKILNQYMKFLRTKKDT
jgi:D-alanyl-D-alanine carboxypeptidase (penicillin-binding protein 5/6)